MADRVSFPLSGCGPRLTPWLFLLPPHLTGCATDRFTQPITRSPGHGPQQLAIAQLVERRAEKLGHYLTRVRPTSPSRPGENGPDWANKPMQQIGVDQRVPWVLWQRFLISPKSALPSYHQSQPALPSYYQRQHYPHTLINRKPCAK